MMEPLKISGDHRTLTLIKVPPLDVHANHIGERVIAGILFEPWLDASLPTSSIAISTL